jgi:hypothetical protein
MEQGSPSRRQRTETVIFDGPIVKGPGGEWHSTPIRVPAGNDLAIEARSPVRFYAGIFDEANYQRLRRMAHPAFPFRFGTDQVAFSISRRAPIDDDYRVVLRVGVFGGQRATIQLRITLTD